MVEKSEATELGRWLLHRADRSAEKLVVFPERFKEVLIDGAHILDSDRKTANRSTIPSEDDDLWKTVRDSRLLVFRHVVLSGEALQGSFFNDLCFDHCDLSPSGLPMVFKGCEFHNCDLEGISAMHFVDCYFYSCNIRCSFEATASGLKSLGEISFSPLFTGDVNPSKAVIESISHIRRNVIEVHMPLSDTMFRNCEVKAVMRGIIDSSVFVDCDLGSSDDACIADSARFRRCKFDNCLGEGAFRETVFDGGRIDIRGDFQTFAFDRCRFDRPVLRRSMLSRAILGRRFRETTVATRATIDSIGPTLRRQSDSFIRDVNLEDVSTDLRRVFSGTQRGLFYVTLTLFLLPYILFITWALIGTAFAEASTIQSPLISQVGIYIFSGGDKRLPPATLSPSCVLFFMLLAYNCFRLHLFGVAARIESEARLRGIEPSLKPGAVDSVRLRLKIHYAAAWLALGIAFTNTCLFAMQPVPVDTSHWREMVPSRQQIVDDVDSSLR